MTSRTYLQKSGLLGSRALPEPFSSSRSEETAKPSRRVLLTPQEDGKAEYMLREAEWREGCRPGNVGRTMRQWEGAVRQNKRLDRLFDGPLAIACIGSPVLAGDIRPVGPGYSSDLAVSRGDRVIRAIDEFGVSVAKRVVGQIRAFRQALWGRHLAGVGANRRAPAALYQPGHASGGSAAAAPRTSAPSTPDAQTSAARTGAEVLETYSGLVDRIEGNEAYLTLWTDTGERFFGHYDAAQLATRGIGEGDRFRCVVRRSGMTVVVDVEPLPMVPRSAARWHELGEEARSLLGMGEHDDARDDPE